MTVIDSRRAAPAVLQLIILPGVVAPALVALWLTWRQGGTAGVRVLAERLTRWQVPVRWYGFALGFMMAVKLAAAVMHRFATGAWPSFAAPGLVPLMILGAVLSTPFQAGEEIGWRGYALPRLAARFGARLASLLLVDRPAVGRGLPCQLSGAGVAPKLTGELVVLAFE